MTLFSIAALIGISLLMRGINSRTDAQRRIVLGELAGIHPSDIPATPVSAEHWNAVDTELDVTTDLIEQLEATVNRDEMTRSEGP